MSLYFQGVTESAEESTQTLRWMVCEAKVTRYIN